MTTTTEMAVSLAHCGVELEALLPAQPKRLLCGLAGQMHDSALCADQDLGHMEELETFRRNGRWHFLFPHILKLTPPKTDLRPVIVWLPRFRDNPPLCT